MNSIFSIDLTRFDVQAELLGGAAMDPSALYLPINLAPAVLGFPSPAEDFEDDAIDLNRHLVRNPAATYFYRTHGWSMVQAGICSGDMLVVDRSVTPKDGDIVVAIWDGNAPACKVLRLRADHMELHSCNPQVPPIVLGAEVQAEVFAVVGVVRQMHRDQGKQGALHWNDAFGSEDASAH
jgi:DNA polymerase V